MQHRLMILGSMEEFTALVQLAHKKGIYTIVCDGYKNGPAKKLADKAIHLDVRATQEIATLCQQEKVDGIIASFSDLLAECLVDIASRTKLKCYCTPKKMAYLRNKTKMKEMFDQLNIPTPPSIELAPDFLAGTLDTIGFPCVIKPLNGYGSRGVLVAQNEAEVREHFTETCSYSSFGSVLAEPYNAGYEFNMMSWILNGQAHVLSIADREKSQEIEGAVPHVSRIVYPSRMMREVYEPARQIIQKVANFTEIETGPLSMQFFYSPEKGLQVCEVAGRFFGYEHELLHYAGGLCIEELLLDYVYDEKAMCRRVEEHDPWLKGRSAGLYFHGYEGEIEDVSAMRQAFAMKIEGAEVTESMLYYNDGDAVSHKVGAKPYVARCYITGRNYYTLDKLTGQLYKAASVKGRAEREMLYRNQLPTYTKNDRREEKE